MRRSGREGKGLQPVEYHFCCTRARKGRGRTTLTAERSEARERFFSRKSRRIPFKRGEKFTAVTQESSDYHNVAKLPSRGYEFKRYDNASHGNRRQTNNDGTRHRHHEQTHVRTTDTNTNTNSSATIPGQRARQPPVDRK